MKKNIVWVLAISFLLVMVLTACGVNSGWNNSVNDDVKKKHSHIRK